MMLSDVWCLSVWRLSVAYIGPKSRTERHRKAKIGAEVGSPRHTWLGHHFLGQKVKGQGHQAALLTAALTREAGVAVTVRTYWAWETTATLRLFGGARGAVVPTGEDRGGGISCRHAQSLLVMEGDYWYAHYWVPF